jgi:hypothetical protein
VNIEVRLSGGILVATVLACSSLAHGQGDSGFLRGAGNLDLAVTYSLDTYDEFWLGNTKINNDTAGFGRVYRQAANVWAGYGLTDEIDLSISGSYVYVSSEEVFPHEDGLQDATVQFKWRFASIPIGKGSLNFLAAPSVEFPMTHYEDNSVTAIGDGNVDLNLHGIIQYIFMDGVFAAIDTGYDVRFDSPPNAFPFNVTVGVTPWEPITITVFYTHIESLSGYNIGQGPFPGVDEDYDRLGGGIYWRLGEKFGITANVYTTLDGKNTGDVDGFSVGAVFRF